MAANNGILTYNNGVYQTATTYYSPTVSIPTTGEKLGSLYCFLSRIDAWENESSPPQPEQSQKYIKDVFKNMFVAKQITTNDMSPVIERVDWQSGETYDYYRDDINMFELDVNDTILYRFYVRNRYDQVFKCLWNNNGEAATDEPRFEPGTFNANLIFTGADGYKWKYMYTITSGNKLKFMDDAWMPVPYSTTSPNPVESTKTFGSIDVINVTNGGSGYDPATSLIYVTVTGDGYSATANAVVDSGSITDISVANTGYGYSYANVSITSDTGSGATAVAYTSPIGGHGFNAVSELGVRHLMVTATFNKSEISPENPTGAIPTDIDFRQIGLLMNPYAYFGTGIAQANAEIYKTTNDISVSPGFGAYIPDELVYQSDDGTVENATFTGYVLSFDSTYNLLKLINTNGTFVENKVIYGQTSDTARVALLKTTPTLVPYSGYIIYLENREAVQRDSEGSEQFRLVLGY